MKPQKMGKPAAKSPTGMTMGAKGLGTAKRGVGSKPAARMAGGVGKNIQNRASLGVKKMATPTKRIV
jgi:hypothetical protein